MTPLQIQILLHYHVSATDYPKLSPPAQKEAIEMFLETGYLEDHSGQCRPEDGMRYTPTEKLHVYCDALCEVPEPKQQWVVGL